LRAPSTGIGRLGRMRRALTTLITVAAVLAGAPSAAAGGTAARDYRGYVDLLDGEPAREGSQGAGWRLIFEERVEGRVRYRVCVRHLRNGERRCWRRRSRGDGVSRVFAALLVNDVGGPGRWRARWTVAGRTVATWRFRVRPESG
jgi:hypothetical protein